VPGGLPDTQHHRGIQQCSDSHGAAIRGWEHAEPKYLEYLFWKALFPNMYGFSEEFWFTKIVAKNDPHFSILLFPATENNQLCQNSTQPSEFGRGTLVLLTIYCNSVSSSGAHQTALSPIWQTV
jgi:hypothetical protein